MNNNFRSDSRVCAVIILFNPDLVVLKSQILSIKSQVSEVVLVDNGSKNIEHICKLLLDFNEDKIELIQNNFNLGLGKAQNIGIARAINIGCSHVILFDQDSILQDGFIFGLLTSEEYLRKKGECIGAIGPIYYSDTTGELYPITKYRGPFIDRILPKDEPVEATFIIASGCLIPINVFEIVGLMNEELFIDYIDVDWSFRAKSLGFKVFASPLSKMSHNIGDNRKSLFGRSISVHSPLRRYYLYRNSIYMMRNPQIAFGYKLREMTFNIIRFLVFFFFSSDRLKYLKYSLFGFFDGIRGRYGKCPYSFD